jgi:hypothetical protein
MFRLAFLAGIAVFIGRIGYFFVQLCAGLIVAAFVLTSVFWLDAIRLAQ